MALHSSPTNCPSWNSELQICCCDATSLRQHILESLEDIREAQGQHEDARLRSARRRLKWHLDLFFRTHKVRFTQFRRGKGKEYSVLTWKSEQDVRRNVHGSGTFQVVLSVVLLVAGIIVLIMALA